MHPFMYGRAGSSAWRHLMYAHMYGPRRGAMHHWMYGGGSGIPWGWIVACSLVGLVLVGAVVYTAVRLAQRHAPLPQ